MEFKVTLSTGPTYTTRLKEDNKFKVSTQLAQTEVANISDISDIDTTGQQDGYVLMYDSATGKYKAVDPDMVFTKAVADDNLPSEFIDQLDGDLDDKIDLDAGSF